jgi:hypothetical protein
MPLFCGAVLIDHQAPDHGVEELDLVSGMTDAPQIIR